MEYVFEPLLSVIIPVYNTEKYLKRCLNSIINQSYKNLEIIIVNDGSTDKSNLICEKIKNSDDRVKLINKDNGGLSSARNVGIELSTGSFITFVDSDDWLDIDIYKKCINIIKKEKCDVVDYKVVYATEKTPTIKEKNEFYSVITGDKILHDYLYKGQTDRCPFSVCRKIYKKSLFDDVSFPTGKVNEDISTNFRILENAKKLANLDVIGYYYFQDNTDSITSGKLKNKDFDLILASEELVELSRKYKNLGIRELAEIKLARSYFSLLAKAATSGIGEDINKNDIDFLTKNLRKNFWLLIKSPIPVNRKILITIMSLNYKLISIPYRLLKMN